MIRYGTLLFFLWNLLNSLGLVGIYYYQDGAKLPSRKDPLCDCVRGEYSGKRKRQRDRERERQNEEEAGKLEGVFLAGKCL